MSRQNNPYGISSAAAIRLSPQRRGGDRVQGSHGEDSPKAGKKSKKGD